MARPGPPPTLAEYRSRAPSAQRQSGGRKPTSSPTVSIVTVVRNGRSTIEQTIRSVLAQGVDGLEYLVVDGASTDGTIEVLRRFEDRLFWISEPDDGISDAFNKGLAMARADVIALLNSDDWYAPGAVAASLEALERTSGAGFTFGDLASVEADGRTRVYRGDPHYARVIHRRMPQLNHPTVFVRRSLYERLGLFRPKLRIAMDYDFLLRLHLAGVHGLYLPRVIAHMRADGLSNRLVPHSYREARDVALSQGEPAVPPWGEYLLSMAGHHAKRALLRLGAESAVERLLRIRYHMK